jgi:hypothetical protein
VDLHEVRIEPRNVIATATATNFFMREILNEYYIGFSVLLMGLSVSIVLIFPYAAQRSWLRQEKRTVVANTIERIIIAFFFIVI